MLALTRYGNLGASSRVRFLQYLPFLESSGMKVVVQALISDEMLRQRYGAGKYSATSQIGAYVRRARVLLQRSKFDVLWIEKEALPWCPFWVERMLLTGVPYVIDYDDAVFHNYDLHPRAFVRYLFGKRLDKLMAGAAAIIAGNRYLAQRATLAGSRDVNIVPTVVDTSRYLSSAVSDSVDDRPRVVWIGSPSTQQYLDAIRGPLRRLAQKQDFVFRIIGADKFVIPGVDIENMRWQEDTEVEDIRRCAVGIMPLTDSPWARGKCGYKLIQYMACGLPVVASPVGANRDIVEHGVYGLLADSDAEWIDSIGRLLADAGARAEMGMAARKRVEDEYSLQAQGPRLLQVLSRAASG